MVDCPRCRRSVPDATRFCHGCGRALADVPEPEADGHHPLGRSYALGTLAAILGAWPWLVLERELHLLLPCGGLVLGAAGFLLGLKWPERFGAGWLGLAGGIASAVYLLGLPARIEQARRDYVAGEEEAALDQVRTMVRAGIEYARSNGGFVDTPRCMGLPERCIPGIPDDGRPPILNPMRYVGSSHGWDPTGFVTGPRDGYVRSFHAGPAAPSPTGRVSATSLARFAYVARPTEQGRKAGLRAFCGESTGRICAGASLPEIADGRCPEACVEQERLR